MAAQNSRCSPSHFKALVAGAGVFATAAFTQSTSSCESAQPDRVAKKLDSKGDQIRLLCLHGINLNMFGKRDPAVYGTSTLADIDAQLHVAAEQHGVEVECFQTNFEGQMVEKIHEAHISGRYAAIMINAGAWTHYSYGLRDALAILKIPIIEVHMSNVHAREDMKGSMGEHLRHHSVISPLAKGVIAGFGLQSYILGLEAAISCLSA